LTQKHGIHVKVARCDHGEEAFLVVRRRTKLTAVLAMHEHAGSLAARGPFGHGSQMICLIAKILPFSVL
jgi:hypothetical protein